jgi:hypothetical protein
MISRVRLTLNPQFPPLFPACFGADASMAMLSRRFPEPKRKSAKTPLFALH